MRNVVLVLAAVMVLQGCGMIVHGERQDLSVTTDPPGAVARVSDAHCVTPCTMKVRRSADTISFTKDNVTEEFYLDKSLNVGSTIFGNLLWIAPGIIIDLIGGGGYTIHPVNVKLGEQKKD